MIITFYSYKGGVGRSMALANIADLLARSGLRVLIVDFDLEAPGVEHFFPIDHEAIRGHEGMLDLLLTFKHSVSVAASDEEKGAYRRLDRFVATVYPFRDGAGGIDLLPAGRRLSEEELGRYGEELRRFDWLDFYFAWSGELFFEWLRRTLEERYDAILVDSRTGVTEMGGVCAYQLADAIVVLCAANEQNLEGTDAMVRHFVSPQVRSVRRDRPLDVLIVPARVDQKDGALRRRFKHDFQARFGSYAPDRLAREQIGFWDLQIPYEPRYAFAEQVVTDPARSDERRSVASAYGKLLTAISLIAPDASKLAGLRPATTQHDQKTRQVPVETRYDPTTRFVAPDVYISYGNGSETVAAAIRQTLMAENFDVAGSPEATAAGAGWTQASSELAQTAKVRLVLVGSEGDRSPWRAREIDALAASTERATIPVVLPGAAFDQIPSELRTLVSLDFRGGIESLSLLAAVGAAISTSASSSVALSRVERNPYPGMAPYPESDADFFFGRDEEVADILEALRRDGRCAVVGGAGVGKTSVVSAGVVPALRRGAMPGSERWPVVALRGGHLPLRALVDSFASLTSETSDNDALLYDPELLISMVQARFERVVLVIDQFEEVSTQGNWSERYAFVSYLDQLTQHESRSVLLVVVVRAEMLAATMALPGVSRLFSSPVVIGLLRDNRLRSAIEAPARRLGVAFEPGLVERLLADMADLGAALPLLQFVLRELWDDQREGFLTHRSYEMTGGTANALTVRADTMLAGFSSGELEIARHVLLRLVDPNESGDIRGRRVDVEEVSSSLQGLKFDTAAVERVVETLIRERILATSQRNETVEVALAYEGLVHTWPRLRAWIDESRAQLEARSRLNAAARDWIDLDRFDGVLLTKDRAEQLIAAMGDSSISNVEREFVDASMRHAQRSQRRSSGFATALGVVAAIVSGVATTLAANVGVDTLPIVSAIVLFVISVPLVVMIFQRTR